MDPWPGDRKREIHLNEKKRKEKKRGKNDFVELCFRENRVIVNISRDLIENIIGKVKNQFMKLKLNDNMS
jgi:hypothetical protein